MRTFPTRRSWLPIVIALLFMVAAVQVASAHALGTTAQDVFAAEAGESMQVYFKLDPRLTGGVHLGDVWVTPPVYEIVSTELTYTLDIKVEGQDEFGQPVALNPDWIVDNPAMLTVSPTQGEQVSVTVHITGESSLQIVSQENSKTLHIKAVYADAQCDVIYVAVAQTGQMPELESPICSSLAVDADGPYSVDEGSSVVISATSNGPDDGSLSYAWDLDNDGYFEIFDQSATFAATGLDGPSNHMIAAQVTDSDDLSFSDTTTVEVLNVTPIVAAITGAPLEPIEVGTLSATVAISTSFADPAGDMDAPYTITITWGDGITNTTSVDSPDLIQANHTYATSGLYAIKVAVTDKDGASGSSTYSDVNVIAAEAGGSMEVYFKLDRRLTGGTYLGDRWVTPPVYEIVSTGLTYTLEIKVEGRDESGQPVVLNPNWIASNPAMLVVSPTQGEQVSVTVQSIGESSLQIVSSEISRTLHIKAVYADSQCDVIHVAVSQTGQMPELESPPCSSLTLDAGGPYSVDEGGSMVVSATSNGPDDGSLNYAWDLDNNGSFEISGQAATFSAVGLDGPSSQMIAAQVTDSDDNSTTNGTSVEVLNVTPTVAAITGAPLEPIEVGTISATVVITTSFADPGGDLDAPYTITITWGDGITDTTSAEIPGVIQANHIYLSPGLYTIKVMVSDKDDATGSNTYSDMNVLQADPRWHMFFPLMTD